MRKLKHIALLSATLGGLLGSAVAAEDKPWLVMADWQSRAADVISHSGGEVGTYGRSRTGIEAIWKRADAAVDFEWYRYRQNFTGLASNSDRRYGDTTDLIITGFRQWDRGDRYAVQLIYAVEWAAESTLALSEGFRWGLGGAVRWQDKVGIGYVTTRDASGAIIIDRKKPYFAPGETNVDLFASYGRRVWKNIDWRVQLNVRNAWGNGDDIPVTANPDGRVAVIRIPNETRWILSNTFTF